MFPHSQSTTIPTFHISAAEAIKEYTPHYHLKTCCLPLLLFTGKNTLLHQVVFSQRSCFKSSIPTTLYLLTVKTQRVHRVALDTSGQSPQLCRKSAVNYFQKTGIEESLWHQQRLKIEANIKDILFLSKGTAAIQNTFEALITYLKTFRMPCTSYRLPVVEHISSSDKSVPLDRSLQVFHHLKHISTYYLLKYISCPTPLPFFHLYTHEWHAHTHPRVYFQVIFF